MLRQFERRTSGWGRFPVATCRLVRPEAYAELINLTGPRLARGQGRAYGDAALNTQGLLVLTHRLNRILAFNESTGILSAEAGVTLKELIDVFLPRGWFPPVVPGTQFVSLGGAVAADVHGKNQHRDGNFSHHVIGLELLGGRGRLLHCTADDAAFRATVGGMGLTGIVCRVDVRLAKVPSSYVVATHRRTSNIEETCRLVLDPAYDDTHTVAWIDATTGPRSVGRAIVMSAHHASIEELPEAQRSHPFALHAKARANIRFDFPSWILNRVGMRAFNATYYALNGRSRGPVVSHVVPFFFPLDNVENWNRIYGNRGFFQYQFVVPNAPVSAIARILEMIRSDHSASFLTVLKRFGNSDCGWLSFPMQGLTVTLDLPYRGAPTLKLLDKLDDVVMQHGGRVYLAKDARMQPSTFRAMYPNFSKWLETKHQIDPDDEFQSLLSRRLGMHREQWHPGC